MRLSIKLQPQDTPWPALQDAWSLADSLPELDAGYLFDHFYPILTDSVVGPCFEGWTALAFLAGATARLRLGLVVTGVTYRNPAVLANMCATLDVASQGRLEIGLGAAWNEEEHHAYGIPFPQVGERMDMLEETCAIVHSLLTERVTTFRGAHYSMTHALCEPKPVQRPRPPFIIGGQGERRLLPIAARWADQWNYPGTEPDGLRHKHEILQRHCDAIGRDPETIEVSTHLMDPREPKAAAERARALAAAGCTHVILYFKPPFAQEIIEDTVRAVADAVL